MQSLAECQINIVLICHELFLLISSEVHFSRVFGGILFPSTKIHNIYHIDNQLVIFLNLFRDYP